MKKKDYLVPFVVSVAVIVILAFLFILQVDNSNSNPIGCVECDECITCPEEKAMLYGGLNYWGENLYDSSEYVVIVDMFNFGYEEAKNVVVTCEMDIGDEDGYTISEIPINTFSQNVGNIASTSYKTVELTTEKDYRKEGAYPLLSCTVTSCENCDILDDRIPELSE